jgi:hypothetical protein
MRRLPARGATLSAAAAGLVFAAFFLADGSSNARLFWIGAAAVLVAAIGWALWPVQLSPAALVFFVALGAFVLWQGISIAWSIQPSRSWDYANRGLVYFTFAAVGALIGGVHPRRLAQGGAVLLGALFTWALAAKVVPALYEDYERLARLRYPVEYWNELALLAAASVPIGLWLAGTRATDRRVRVTGTLLLYAALVVAVLAYSRVGIVLTLVAAIVWLAIDRERLEAIGPLAVAWAAGAPVAGIALLLPGVSDDGQPYDVRVQDGLVFGALLIVGAMLAAVVAWRFVLARPVERRTARLLAGGLAMLVLVAFVAAVVRSGGPVDFVNDRWHEFANPVSAQVEQTGSRLVSASSSNRWRWWTEAWNSFLDHPLNGTGAGTFWLTDRIERESSLAVTEPHSAPLQDLSETGIVGLVLIVAALGAAAYAVLRRERTRASTALALGAGLCVAHTLVDIDWDYVAAMGPLFLTVGALVAAPAAPAARSWFRAGFIGVAAIAVLYSLLSPWLAQRRVDAAYDAIVRGDLVDARGAAKSARSLNPLAVESLWILAGLETDEKALELYRQARDREPKNPETWYRLGLFELLVLDRPRDAYRDLNQSYTLDDYGPAAVEGGALDQARCAIDPATCPG